jgi:hypothetical protein
MLIDLERNDLGAYAARAACASTNSCASRAIRTCITSCRTWRRAVAGTDADRRAARGVSRRHHHRLSEIPLHADHRRTGGRGAPGLYRRHRLHQRRRFMDFNILIRSLTLRERQRENFAPARASSPIRTGSASWPRRAPRRAACSRHWAPHDRPADRWPRRRQHRQRRSRPAVRRRPVRDHLLPRRAGALAGAAPGAPAAGLRAAADRVPRLRVPAACGDPRPGGRPAALHRQGDRDARHRDAPRLCAGRRRAADAHRQPA